MPDYDFRSLSPIDFEMLTRDLLNADLGLQLVSFGVGPDGGVDLRDTSDGKVVIVQCKHRPDAMKAALIGSARAEASRWTPDQMDQYLFVVSSTVSPAAEVEIIAALSPLPVAPTSVWHQGALNAAIGRNRDVEKSHFKLWLSSATALERIASASQWQRSEELLQRVTDRVKLYVHTPAYLEATMTLEREHVVLISGAPGVGKSTLAEMLLLNLWHDGWTVVNIASDIDEAWRQVRASTDRVVFYYDDFLGQTSTAELQKNEGAGIAQLLEKLRRGDGNQLLVLTSREQVLNQARHGVDDRVRRLADDNSKLRIELHKVSRIARAQMLFNHLHFGFQEESSRTALATDDRYRRVVDHVGFNPRVLESVVLGQKHVNSDALYEALFQALDHPDSIWDGSFRQLSTTATAILFQLAVSPSGSMAIQTLRDAVSPEDPRDWLPALKVLENTWIRLVPHSGSAEHATLFDPSRRDFLLDLLSDAGYFDAVLDSISSLGQLNYLYTLAGFREGGGVSDNDQSRAIRSAALRRVDDIDMIGLKLANRQIASAGRSESGRHVGNGTALRNTQQITHPAPAPVISLARILALTDLGSLCFGLDVPSPKAEDFLHTQLAVFDEGTRNIGLSAASAFDLAATLASIAAPGWSAEYAAKIASLAFDSALDSEDLHAYSKLPKAFRDGPYRVIGQARMRVALEQELEGIEQQDDRDVMSQWLDDIILIAQENDVDFSVSCLRERIDEMPNLERADDRFRATAASQPPELSGTDEDLRDLFERLKS